MVRPKQVPVEERLTVFLTLKTVPCFAVVSDHPSLAGIYGVGFTAQQAQASMRAEIRRRYPSNQYDIMEALA